MRVRIVTFVALAALSAPASESMAEPSDQVKRSKEFKSEYAIPASPAFSLLDAEPATVLRPGTVRELMVEVSSFVTDSGQYSLPKDLGVEFSPGLLVKGRTLSIADYQANQALYRVRLSLATRRVPEAGSATNVALGVRATLLDDADIRGAKANALRTDLLSEVSKVHDARDAVRNRLLEERKRFKPEEVTPELVTKFLVPDLGIAMVGRARYEDRPVSDDVTDKEVRHHALSGAPEPADGDSQGQKVHAAYVGVATYLIQMGVYEDATDVPESEVRDALTKEQQKESDQLNDLLARKIREFSEANWNATILEFALGVSGVSADSTGSDVKVDRLAAWFSYGVPTGSLGQLLVAARGGSKKPEGERVADGSAAGRVLFGSRDYQAWIETAASFEEGRRPVWDFLAGTNLKGPSDTWLDVQVGIERESDGATRLVSNVSARVGIPEIR